MFNWSALTLFLYIAMRMAGFLMMNPLFGRQGVPNLFLGGFIGFMTLTAYSAYEGTVAVPGTLLELAVRLLRELGLGFVLSMVIRFFLYLTEEAGQIVDTQMGLGMARTYDPTSRSNATPTANILNMLMILLFFTANGHVTLLRMMLTSGEVVPFGEASLGDLAVNRGVELFAECCLLALKLCLPILGAELLGQIGMGVLMKVIPQINVFAINIELKVIVGLFMLLMLMSPMSRFLLETESLMLGALRDLLALCAPG